MTNQESPTTTKYAIRPYDADAIPAVLELVKQVLGNHKTVDFWRWKHHQNLFGESCGLYAWNEDEHTVVGLRILMRWTFRSPDGQEIRAVRAVDTVTHPAYRRQGVFSTLTRQAVDALIEEEVHLIFNTPNRHTSLPGYLRLGWQVVADWPVYIRALNLWRTMHERVRHWPVGGPRLSFDRYFGPQVVTWNAFVSKYQAVLPAFISTWEKSRITIGFRTPRDMAYLQWRYGQHPHVEYGFYAREDAGSLAGFVILRPNVRHELREIVLNEMFLREPDVELGQALLEQTFRQLHGDYVIAHFGQGTLERDLLRQVGFAKVPFKGILFTIRPLDSLPQHASNAANWDLCLGDLEVF